MERQYLSIEGISALLWGPASDRLFIAVHGDQSNKEDAVIAILAEEALAKGYQVLSFDLPEHGARKEEKTPCKPENCIADLNTVLRYAQGCAEQISLFGCSIGAYFAMLAYRDERIAQALFLSPVVDMRRIIENIMTWFGVSAERLEMEQEIATPAKTLYWDYYQYVLAHPVEWNKPTALLYGAQDSLCEFATIQEFAERVHGDMTILEGGEHFFHTEEQLSFFRQWLRHRIVPASVSL